MWLTGAAGTSSWGQGRETDSHCIPSEYILTFLSQAGTFTVKQFGKEEGEFSFTFNLQRWYPSQSQDLEFDNDILSSVEMPL